MLHIRSEKMKELFKKAETRHTRTRPSANQLRLPIRKAELEDMVRKYSDPSEFLAEISY